MTKTTQNNIYINIHRYTKIIVPIFSHLVSKFHIQVFSLFTPWLFGLGKTQAPAPARRSHHLGASGSKSLEKSEMVHSTSLTWSPIESEFDREFVGTPFLVKNRVVFLGSYGDQCWFFMVIDGDLMVMNGDLPSGKLTVGYWKWPYFEWVNQL